MIKYLSFIGLYFCILAIQMKVDDVFKMDEVRLISCLSCLHSPESCVPFLLCPRDMYSFHVPEAKLTTVLIVGHRPCDRQLSTNRVRFKASRSLATFLII